VLRTSNEALDNLVHWPYSGDSKRALKHTKRRQTKSGYNKTKGYERLIIRLKRIIKKGNPYDPQRIRE